MNSEPISCPSCNAAMPSDFRFCGYCGVLLRDSGVEPAAVGAPLNPVSTGPAPEERRRVSVLFADLSGSTSLADRLDPDQAYRILAAVLRGLAGEVEACGGYVAKTLGDGLMALFGAPRAHEDDPVRAANAGLRLQEWMNRQAPDLDDGLRLRVGIHYGPVVAAHTALGESTAYDVLGDTVNVAQRLEAAAEPGSVCVSEPFYRLTRRAFEYRDRGSRTVKGKREPLRMYWLTGRRHGTIAETPLPLAGREREIGELREAVEALASGSSTLLAVCGDRGLGKSRLLDELVHELAARSVPTLRAATPEGGQTAPLLVWRTWLLEWAGIDRRTTFEEAALAFGEMLDGEDYPWSEWLAALAAHPDRLLTLDEDARKRVTHQAIQRFLERWRSDRPAALLVDDADLLDPLSYILLQEAVLLPGMLVAMGGRPQPHYPPASARVLALEPLSVADSRRLLEESLYPASISPQVVERSGGNPLYLERMIGEAKASEDPAATLARLPDSLYGLLRAQVDSLDSRARAVLEAAAVLGVNFAEEWIEALSPDRDARQRLESSGLLTEHRPRPMREIAFQHAALQEAVYEGLLQDRRLELHRAAAEELGRDAVVRPELAGRAASHFQLSGDASRAIEWMLRAADHAGSFYDGEEAVRLYRDALDLAERSQIPRFTAEASLGLGLILAHRGEFTAARERLEVGETAALTLDDPVLQASLARARARVLAQIGAFHEAEPCIDRALDLLRPLADERARKEFVRALVESAHLDHDLGRLQAALEAASSALEMAQREGWDTAALDAGTALGLVLLSHGDTTQSRQVLEQATARADRLGDWQGAAGCRINLARCLQVEGCLAEALDVLAAAGESASRTGDQEKLALIRLNQGLVYLSRGDWVPAAAAFRDAAALFAGMDHPLGQAAALCNLVDTLRLAGDTTEAAGILDSAERHLDGVESDALRVHLTLARAELSLTAGDLAPAVRQGEEALALAESIEYPTGMAAAHLTRGRILRALGERAAATESLKAAVAGFDEAGERLDAARARAELAATTDDLAHAAELAAQARAVLESLGAAGWLAVLPGLSTKPLDVLETAAR